MASCSWPRTSTSWPRCWPSRASAASWPRVADFHRVEAEIAKLRLSRAVGQTFTRTDDAYRGVYELLRTGRMPEAESMIGQLLNSLMGEGKEGVLRTQRIDGSKLPEYDMVRRYLGPAGMTVTTEADGWFLTGFTLNKEARTTASDARRPDCLEQRPSALAATAPPWPRTGAADRRACGRLPAARSSPARR